MILCHNKLEICEKKITNSHIINVIVRIYAVKPLHVTIYSYDRRNKEKSLSHHFQNSLSHENVTSNTRLRILDVRAKTYILKQLEVTIYLCYCPSEDKSFIHHTLRFLISERKYRV